MRKPQWRLTPLVMWSMRRWFAVAALSFLLVCSAWAQSPPSQATGYNLVWEDTFSMLNLCTTNLSGCNWYNPGVWWKHVLGTVADPSGTYVDLQWNSGQGDSTNISTASTDGTYHRAWTYGYFEISMRFNPVTGSSPAFYMVPEAEVTGNTASDGVYYGELDGFEWQSNMPTNGLATVHVWRNQVDVKNNNSTDIWTLPGGTDLSEYNTYGVLWTPTRITWYFNNVQVNTVDTTISPYNLTFAGQQAYFIILGQQPGCNSVPTCTGQVSPLDMKVQWVHVYAPPSVEPPTHLTAVVK
jgi:beta-glucanase (GH16 family)